MTKNTLVGIGSRMAETMERIRYDAIEPWVAKTPQEREQLSRARDSRHAQLAALTPQEKWDRLKNPTCADDYGLLMTPEEVRAVPEAEHEFRNHLAM
jgi:hypothetical protein